MLMLGKFHCKCAHLNKNRVKPTQLFLNFFLLPISKGSVTLVEESLVHKLRM